MQGQEPDPSPSTAPSAVAMWVMAAAALLVSVNASYHLIQTCKHRKTFIIAQRSPQLVVVSGVSLVIGILWTGLQAIQMAVKGRLPEDTRPQLTFFMVRLPFLMLPYLLRTLDLLARYMIY
ncbi:unnamed protein product [Chrysoparadoxa australica]